MRSLNKKTWRLLHQGSSDALLNVLIANRQIEDLDAFLQPDFNTHLHNPFLIPDMQKAVDMLRRAVDRKANLMIVGDYDADGITGTAVLYEMLKSIGIDHVICRLPHRIHDGYGFQAHIVDEAVRDNVDLIVTVDNGVSSIEAITKAKEQGLGVIVCDHHTIPAELPPADAILHPKMDQGDYPFKDLTGVGVAFKLAQAICPRVLSSKDAEKMLKWSLDLVAIGTVADCATVTGENRVLIKYGLIVIEKTRRPGLQQVLSLCQGKNPSYDTSLIGFRIAPRINAAGRLSSADTSLKLLITQNSLEASVLAQELQDLNTRRQQQTLESVRQAIEQLQVQIACDKILIAKHKDWHPGIVGLIAGRLTEQFNRPSIIFHEDQKGRLVGSARSIESFNMINAITQQSDILLRFGGHSQAAGCSLAPEQFQPFCERMKALANDSIADDDLYPVLPIDCELWPHQLTLKVKHEIDTLQPYGIGNDRPLFVLRNMELSRINPVGKGNAHLQLWFTTKERTLKGIAFQMGHLSPKLKVGEFLDVACHLQENTWNGNTSLELEIVDLQRPQESV